MVEKRELNSFFFTNKKVKKTFRYIRPSASSLLYGLSTPPEITLGGLTRQLKDDLYFGARPDLEKEICV